MNISSWALQKVLDFSQKIQPIVQQLRQKIKYAKKLLPATIKSTVMDKYLLLELNLNEKVGQYQSAVSLLHLVGPLHKRGGAEGAGGNASSGWQAQLSVIICHLLCLFYLV